MGQWDVLSASCSLWKGKTMLTRMYLYSTSTKLSIDVWLYLDRPGSLITLAYQMFG